MIEPPSADRRQWHGGCSKHNEWIQKCDSHGVSLSKRFRGVSFLGGDIEFLNRVDRSIQKLR